MKKQPKEINYEILRKVPFQKRREIISNVQHKPNTISECVRMSLCIERLAKKEAIDRMTHRKKNPQGKFPEGQVRDLIGGLFGMSGKTYEKAKFVVESRRKEYINRMNRTCKVNPVFLALFQKKNGEKLIKKAQAFKSDRIQILGGDFRDVCKNIKDESVNAVICDPPYLRKSLYLWEPLGELSKRVLKPGGYLITYTGVMFLNEVMDALSKNLTYFWEVSVLHTLAPKAYRANAANRHKDILLFYKPPYRKPRRTFQDVIKSPAPEKDLHRWQQPENELRELVDIFTNPGDLVLDPFCGSGSLVCLCQKMNRRCIAIDIDPECVLITKGRLSELKCVGDGNGSGNGNKSPDLN
jgi:site-specific DNA-adenine methylase